MRETIKESRWKWEKYLKEQRKAENNNKQKVDKTWSQFKEEINFGQNFRWLKTSIWS
jgi:hypothetical protein